MIQRKRQNSQSVRLGELFTESGLIPQDALTHSLVIARRSQMPIGRVLVMSGFISEKDVDCALQAQEFVKSGRTPREVIGRIMRIAHSTGVTAAEALAIHDMERAYSISTSQLGRLLIATGVLCEEVVLEATRQSAAEGITLGQYLVTHGKIDALVLTAALNLQILVRDKRLTRLQAAQALRHVAVERVCLAKAFADLNFEGVCEHDQPRIGDLLLAAGVLPESHLREMLELSLEHNAHMGEILNSRGLISRHLLESALQLQRMLNDKTIRISRALELIRLVHELQVPLEQIFAELDQLSQIVHFLRVAKLLDEKRLRDVASQYPDDFNDNPARALTEHGLVDLKMLEKAAECLSYFRTGQITEEQAAQTLIHSVTHDVEPAQALEVLRERHFAEEIEAA